MAPDEESRRRELDFVQWLDMVKTDAAAIFLLGDLFDFWFEYRYVVPRGFVRLLGKLAELTDNGIPIYYFAGNHDQWMRDYLIIEMNIQIYLQPAQFELNGKLFFIGHGHGHDVSPEGLKNRLLCFAFSNRLLRMLFASLHPRWGIALGANWSMNSRKRRGICKPFNGVENESIYRYTQYVLTKKHYDFFVFGHRHLALDLPLNENSRYINTGEWIETQTYAVFDGNEVSLHSAKGKS
jgi:UDP-2,3-diacylglucosamine hydrolase